MKESLANLESNSMNDLWTKGSNKMQTVFKTIRETIVVQETIDMSETYDISEGFQIGA